MVRPSQQLVEPARFTARAVRASTSAAAFEQVTELRPALSGGIQPARDGDPVEGLPEVPDGERAVSEALVRQAVGVQVRRLDLDRELEVLAGG